ncbi:MAG: IS110 family transposase [Pseudomonadales bacterium]|nr:IS110 family transposase [Pseudomonadales bacterium]
MNTTPQFYLGIDISKRHFDVALLAESGKRKNKKFNNTDTGFARLLSWLEQQHAIDIHACMEATNVYGNRLAEYLFDQGIPISMVNPTRVKGFAQSELLRSKTDKQDASLIARFCQAMKPRLWEPEPLAIRQLKALVKRLDMLVEMRQQEVNRLDVADDVIRPDIEHHIQELDQRILKLREEIKSHIDDDPGLKEQKELLLSIPGIGEKTLATLLAYFSSISRFDNAKKLASFCGVAPRVRESGTSVKGRGAMSKIGSSHLRKSLFFPAMVALRHNPALKQLRDRLVEKGKPKMVIIGAAMRKLIHIIYGVLKNRTPFDEKLAIRA